MNHLKHDVQLHCLAHSRTGDKDGTANISLIAYLPDFFPLLVEQVTEERVAELFRHRGVTAVRRYVLPKLEAINFVLENVLDGGVNDSLNLDTHGKTLAFLLLSMKIAVPVVAEAGGMLGVPPIQVAQAALLGQMTTGFPVSPLTPATFLLVGLADIDLGEHQKFTAPFLLAASVVMTLACVMFGIFPL